MGSKDNTIAGRIDLLARQTGAAPDFVERIRCLFSNKGISLETDVSPYFKALDEAFERERRLRVTAQQTRQNLERLHEQLLKFNRTFKQQLERIKGLRDTGRRPAVAARATTKQFRIVESSVERPAAGWPGKGFLVPGPKDTQ